MRLCLRVCQRKSEKGYPLNKRFSFAVIDLDKANSYPLNFVCMLPIMPIRDPKAKNTFSKTFGNTSYEVAQKLLQNALKRESNPEVKDELKRRLKLLEPKPIVERRCIMCGKTFQVKPKHVLNRKHCPECYKKKLIAKGQYWTDDSCSYIK